MQPMLIIKAGDELSRFTDLQGGSVSLVFGWCKGAILVLPEIGLTGYR
jgi:hypothetical protein